MTLPTGSSLPIFKHCGYSFRDDVVVPSLRTATDETEGGEGHSIHEDIADALEGKPQPEDPERRAIISQIMQRIGDDKILDYESAWAWNPTTGKSRKLGTRINRKYAEHGATPEDVCLTLDLVLLRASELVVVDFKSGYGTHTDAVEDKRPIATSRSGRNSGIREQIASGLRPLPSRCSSSSSSSKTYSSA
jgi:hypothetical protein